MGFDLFLCCYLVFAVFFIASGLVWACACQQLASASDSGAQQCLLLAVVMCRALWAALQPATSSAVIGPSVSVPLCVLSLQSLLITSLARRFYANGPTYTDVSPRADPATISDAHLIIFDSVPPLSLIRFKSFDRNNKEKEK
jgi:hypothetical protein